MITQNVFNKNRTHDKKIHSKWNAIVFGECGQGKSTVLTEISRLNAMKFCPPGTYAAHFASSKSYGAVTPCVRKGSTGNMTLVDSPGFNDANI